MCSWVSVDVAVIGYCEVFVCSWWAVKGVIATALVDNLCWWTSVVQVSITRNVVFSTDV